MVITSFDLGIVWLATVILAIFSFKFRMCFFKVKHYFGDISGMVGPIDVKRKGSALVPYWVWYVTLTFDLTHDLYLGCFNVKFEIAVSQELLVWLMWNKKEANWEDILGSLYDHTFDHTHDLDLGASRSGSQIALSQEWDGWSPWNGKDVSHPFMNMILTSVTIVGGRIYWIVTGVTSDVGVPSTYLAVCLFLYTHTIFKVDSVQYWHFSPMVIWVAEYTCNKRGDYPHKVRLLCCYIEKTI